VSRDGGVGGREADDRRARGILRGRGLKRIDWEDVERSLDEIGHARLRGVLGAAECRQVARFWADEALFRKHIVMERLRFGVGDYKYFAAPLPPLVERLRRDLYAGLAPIANRWADHLGEKERYPATLAEFLAHCHERGQTKPTPLVLRYEKGGLNRLHQDLYGSIAFPLQVTIFLDRPGEDYEGGEFLLVESPPRAQSIGHAIRPERGDMIVFPNAERPIAGKRGFYRTRVRHGVSRVLSGRRFTLGIIFHDAK
jgi:uncharacterized protein